jgi:undecaprenyl-diphosphatase
MNLLEALFLGVVEGVTEFLPISSTGHLLLAQRGLGIERGEAADAWSICVQGGAIVAVMALYPARCKQMLRGLLGRDSKGRSLAIALFVAFLPAATLGLFAKDAIRERLFGLTPVAWAWLVGGVVLLALKKKMRPEAGGRELSTLSLGAALGIGLLQCAAFWPGTSRSLVTILGGVLVGLSVAAAVEFSFLLGLVTLLAASTYEGWIAREALLGAYSPAVMFTGFVAAFASAALSMRWLVSWVRERGLEVFGWYRVALGLGVLAWLEVSG